MTYMDLTDFWNEHLALKAEFERSPKRVRCHVALPDGSHSSDLTVRPLSSLKLRPSKGWLAVVPCGVVFSA
jgi:hypothetical protein